MILLSESANRSSAKQGGQELIGGLDVRITRNYFGRQTESFETDLTLPFLDTAQGEAAPFRGIFIRAPVVEAVLAATPGEQKAELQHGNMVVAPSRKPVDEVAAKSTSQAVEVMGVLPGRKARIAEALGTELDATNGSGDIIAVRQGNVFGCSFHPELTTDARIHVWWLREVLKSFQDRPRENL
jgi:5'-phosphate synthase pdxT subunit